MIYWFSLTGLAFICYALAVVASDLRALKRRQSAMVTCVGFGGRSFGETLYEMAPVGRNGKPNGRGPQGYLRLKKTVSIRRGQEVEVVYDPERPERLYLADRAPRYPTAMLVVWCAVIGASVLLYGFWRLGPPV